MKLNLHRFLTLATTFVVAFVVYSCKGNLSSIQEANTKEIPIQVVDSIFMLQSKNGDLEIRMEAPLMERYENDTANYEKFPKGFYVFAYDDNGLLETTIISDQSLHYQKKNSRYEYWKAFGNVIVKNIQKKEELHTDTLYWDQSKKEIYTDTYVKLFSQSGMMQGYGMHSDEYARNVIIEKPFDSFGVLVKDTTKVIIDSINFIGPILKNTTIKP